MSGYVALDGPDGSGKSTQAERLVAALRAEGRDVVHLREPGSTVFGERLRETLLDPRVGRLDAVTEVLAFSAARREMLVREVAPARARGADVVVERCFAATLVYQGIAAAEPAPLDWIEQVTAAVVAGIVPDVVVLLDVDAAVATARRPAARDRIEAAGAAFHERVVEGFRRLQQPGSPLARLLGSPARIVGVAADGPVEAVARAVLDAVRPRLGAVS